MDTDTREVEVKANLKQGEQLKVVSRVQFPFLI